LQPKSKKQKKFAVVKRLLSPKDARIKKNQELAKKKKQKEEEKKVTQA
jgi:U3 small nucleolar RNA-associated protein 24